MKLELKHIVGYLPYGLKMISQNDFVSPLIRELRVDGFQFMIETRKPILRPLSDLTKEIEIDGKKFTPTKVLHWNNEGREIFFIYPETTSYSDILKLYEWKFDVHGLIAKGLAVNINILNK
jgi:hypothetical protein